MPTARRTHPKAQSAQSAREVARVAGVSISTAARVLRGDDAVASSTREKVLHAAAELGFDLFEAVKMRPTRQRAPALGFLLHDHYALRSEFHGTALAAFEWRLNQRETRVVIAHPRGGDFAGLAKDILHSGQCAGLVVQADSLSREQIHAVAAIKAPIVFLNYHPAPGDKPPDLTAVGFDNAAGTVQAVRHLAALGHRRVAYIGGTPGSNDAVQREIGFRVGLLEVGLPIRESWMRPGHFGGAGTSGYESGVVQMDYLLAEGDAGPTAVICASDEIAAGAISSARRCGRRIPEQLSLIGFDNHTWSALIDPPLTTVEHDGWALGVEVADQLSRLLDREQTEPDILTLETRLVVRRSTARPGQEASNGLG